MKPLAVRLGTPGVKVGREGEVGTGMMGFAQTVVLTAKVVSIDIINIIRFLVILCITVSCFSEVCMLNSKV